MGHTFRQNQASLGQKSIKQDGTWAFLILHPQNSRISILIAGKVPLIWRGNQDSTKRFVLVWWSHIMKWQPYTFYDISYTNIDSNLHDHKHSAVAFWAVSPPSGSSLITGGNHEQWGQETVPAGPGGFPPAKLCFSLCPLHSALPILLVLGLGVFLFQGSYFQISFSICQGDYTKFALSIKSCFFFFFFFGWGEGDFLLW